MVKPIDKANHIALKSTICMKGKTAKHELMKKPRKCPPIILFGSAAKLFGKAKTINAIVFAHKDDIFEDPKTLSFFENFKILIS